MDIAELTGTLKNLAISAAIPLGLLASALALGGPGTPPPIEELAAAFDAVDFSEMPVQERFLARDGTSLAYRKYGNSNAPTVVMLHGSGGAGLSLHPLAVAVAETGRQVIVPDIRGHGTSGKKGDMSHDNQAVEDIDDLIAHLSGKGISPPVSMLGFSMGGGLALKYAANAPGKVDRLVLLSPYLAHDAPPVTMENAHAIETKWAEAGVPRIIALSMLNALGITAFNGLEVIRLATQPEDAEVTTPSYTYRLMKAVNPRNWKSDMAAVENKLTVVATAADELHAIDGFRAAIDTAAPDAGLIVVDGLSHIDLTLSPIGADAVIAALEGRS